VVVAVVEVEVGDVTVTVPALDVVWGVGGVMV
jgi:hypothetical protein